MEIIIGVLGLVAGAVVIYLMMNAKLSVVHSDVQQKMVDIDRITNEKLSVETKYEELRLQYHDVSVLKGELTSRCEELLRQIATMKSEHGENETRMKVLFENIATKIIDDRKEKMDKMGAEQLKALLTPFGDNIERFKEQVQKAYFDEARERHTLEQEIKRLVEANQRISEDANNLTNALKGSNKTQGNWGEMILERILESSGLVCGVEGYELQSMLRDANGNPIHNESGRKMIPDAIVHFPDNRNVIIDSKVSLSAYVDYCNCENEQEQALHLKKHITSIKGHISELDVKSYENYVAGSLDFVMMFIPNESAYLMAMHNEPALWNDAYKKKVLLISPTNLIASLKIVSDLWTREQQNKNIEEIISRGERLYDKCRTFLEAMLKIEKGLSTATNSYGEAYRLLAEGGGVIRQAEMLRELGIKSKKELPIKSIESEEKMEESNNG